MIAQQRIVRVRRQYNQWVANQTLEDYALRFTAKSARRWSVFRVANTALGAISFLALEAIGGTVTLNYGFTNAAAAILAVGLVILVTGLPIVYSAAKHGVDIDLLTRGAGFGYIGSTVTSLIYASFTFIFFAIEAAILSTALRLCFGIPLATGYVISALVIIPLVTHGFTFISRFQLWTQAIWALLQVAPFVFLIVRHPGEMDGWTSFPAAAGGTGFDLLLFGPAASVVFALIAQIGEQVDVLRFLPAVPQARRRSWWLAVAAAGPGWILLGMAKLFAGSFLAVLAVRHGIPQAGDPSHMYLALFGRISVSPGMAVGLTGLFVVLSQLKINVTNAYAGSIAWSNFFSRLTHSHPGRVVWLIFNVAIALLLMEFGVYEALEQVLGLYAVVAIAWVGTIVADLVINKPLGLSPAHIEFRRAHLYDINPVGIGSMLSAILLAVLAHSNAFGPTAAAFSSFIALAVPFVAAPALAFATRGRYYLARQVEAGGAAGQPIRCCICEYSFEPEDMAHCTAYGGPICSLCCSLDARCRDSCKSRARLADQLLDFAAAIFPRRVVVTLDSRLGHFLCVFLLTTLTMGLALLLIYTQVTLNADETRAAIRLVMWKIYAVMTVVAGIAVWLFVLVQESRRVAQEESSRQTSLLIAEIEAHKRTDVALQKAKEAAEAANLAKSRYVVGMSHELRSPLNSIFGYAQLLERDKSIPVHRRDAVTVIRRSSEHLAGLIEGLLDISKIEAGHLRLQRDEVRLRDFLEQIVDMFRLQAEARGLDFFFEAPPTLPAVVHADEKRLRQILINLLSNAIKFTETGHVALRLRCPGEVTEFTIEDTGIGIPRDDIERVFEPFERGRQAQTAPGTGLGLTITKLLTEIMGGQIAVSSQPGMGSRFRVKLLLSDVAHPGQAAPAKASQVHGYSGRRLTVLVADDNPAHRALISDILSPLGFILFAAEDGAACLKLAEQFRPDLFLLDISMPDMDGWAVAQRLRRTGFEKAVIIMVSANAAEYRAERRAGDVFDDFLVKPIDIVALTEKIGRLFDVDWLYQPLADAPLPPAAEPAEGEAVPPRKDLDDLRRLAEIGYVQGLRARLDAIEAADDCLRPFVAKARGLVDAFQFGKVLAYLGELRDRSQ